MVAVSSLEWKQYLSISSKDGLILKAKQTADMRRLTNIKQHRKLLALWSSGPLDSAVACSGSSIDYRSLGLWKAREESVRARAM
mmetsp:Transcript_19964/g.27448  ORF Transcript_19964/g.27448 Transcript_19964/m.27448 type:complete len:84 (-) Transcript_19964:327-578(-)